MKYFFTSASCENVAERNGRFVKTPPRTQVTKNDMDVFSGEIFGSTDYYAFGMQMPGRNFSSPSYRFGFNGQEKDDEIVGVGNHYSFEFRESDPRLGGQFWSVDPLSYKYPGWSTYIFAQQTPIWARELEGLEAWYPEEGIPQEKIPRTEEGDFDITNIEENAVASGPLSESGRQGLTTEPSIFLGTFTVTPDESYKNTVAYALFGELASGRGLSESENPYIWTDEEIKRGVSMELNIGILATGAGGLATGLEAGLSSLGWGTLGRAGANAAVQFAGNYLATGNVNKSLERINLIQSGLVGLGVGLYSTAITSSALFVNYSGNFGSTFNGKINTSQFLAQSTLGLGFGYAGRGISNYVTTQSFKGAVIGTYMRTSLGMGQPFGFGLSSAIYYGIKGVPNGLGVTSGYLGVKITQ